MRDVWIAPNMRLIETNERRKRLPPCDYPAYLPGVPIFSRRAVDALFDLLEPCGELLPIACSKGEWLFFNTTCVIDALDVSASVVNRADDDGHILYIEIPAFKRSAVKDAIIFKLPQLTYSDVYVTESFVERVEQAELLGFDFRSVWTSDDEQRADK